jgi:gingipain R
MKNLKKPLWIILALTVCVSYIGPRLWQNVTDNPSENRLLLGTLTSAQNDAKWISIGGKPQDIAQLDITQSGIDNPVVKFKMPGFYLESVKIAGKLCSRVSMPEHIMLQTAGLPEVPVLSRSLNVPAGSKTTLKIVEHRTRQFKVDPVEPSVGYLTRNVDPKSVTPEFDDFYQRKEVWPKEVVQLGNHFTLREYEGVNIRVHPLRYDAGKGMLLVTETLVVEITIESPDGHLKSTTAVFKPGGQEFRTVYKRIFGSELSQARTDKYAALPSRGRMLIIAHKSLAGSMGDFVAWKQQLGIDVTLLNTDQIGGTNTAIASSINTMYQEAKGLTWVLLVGDIEQVPTNSGGFDGSDSDTRYAMLAGDDLYPDIYISRISATNTTQLTTQLNKFITYEKSPETGAEAAWYQHGTCIASNEGSPSDTERAELLRTSLLGFGFHTVAGIYQGQGGNSLSILTTLNAGTSLVNYLGHGTGTSWSSVYFSNSQIHSLQNGPYWPWIIDVSCSNGDFALDECMAEAWMRAGTPEAPQGALGIIAATSLAPWVPPTVMQTEVIDLLTNEEAFTLGALYYSGLMKVLDEYSGISVAEQVMDQNLVFGDCSLMVRTAKPTAFTVAGPENLASADSRWWGQVDGPEGSVATLTWDGVLYGLGMVAADGGTEILLTESLADAPQILLTVSGVNMVPHRELLSIDGNLITPTEPVEEIEENNDPVASLPEHVNLLGNYPNPFNPSTRIAFELPVDTAVRLGVYDIRGRLVRMLVNETLGSGKQEILWDGSDSRGSKVSSGVYLYRLETFEGVETGRMTLSK